MESSNINVREYQEGDKKVVLEFIKALQDFELSLGADRVNGEDVSEPYLEYILYNCYEKNGKVFIAENEREVAGFGCVWIESDLNPISSVKKYGYISDLFIELDFREKGIGQILVETMEDYIKSLDIRVMQFNTLANNELMQKFAKKCKYKKSELTYLKEV